MSYWDKKPVFRSDKLPRYGWLAGLFHATHDWDGTTWIQNRHELQLRDVFLSQLGNPAGKKILEVGCGAGTYMLILAQAGAEVSGQDINEEEVNRGRRIFAELGIEAQFAAGDAAKLKFADDQFDFVVSADVFEHISLETKRAVAEEIYRVLKPGGLVVIKTPNLRYLQMVIWAKRAANLARLKSPRIYIAHTRNNPDTEHHGLTTYRKLERVFLEYPFLPPDVINTPLRRGRFAIRHDWNFPLRRWFNEHLIMSFRKSLNVPVAERLNRPA